MLSRVLRTPSSEPTATVNKENIMTYLLVVYNKAGESVFEKLYQGVSGTFMHEICNDYLHHGGKGATVDFYLV